MTVVGPVLFLLGIAVCWGIGRYLNKRQGVLVPVTTALFGIAGLLAGFPGLWSNSLIWSLVVLAVYGAIGSLVHRAGRTARENAE